MKESMHHLGLAGTSATNTGNASLVMGQQLDTKNLDAARKCVTSSQPTNIDSRYDLNELS